MEASTARATLDAGPAVSAADAIVGALAEAGTPLVFSVPPGCLTPRDHRPAGAGEQWHRHVAETT